MPLTVRQNLARCKIHFKLTSKSCVLLLAALLHGTPEAGASHTLRRVTRNAITELSQRAPHIPQGGHHVGHRPTFLVNVCVSDNNKNIADHRMCIFRLLQL